MGILVWLQSKDKGRKRKKCKGTHRKEKNKEKKNRKDKETFFCVQRSAVTKVAKPHSAKQWRSVQPPTLPQHHYDHYDHYKPISTDNTERTGVHNYKYLT